MTDSAETPARSGADHALHSTTHHCFGCGKDNPNGLHLHFTLDHEAHTASAHVHLSRLFEGPPGHIHGGIIATLMDEAMSKLNRLFGELAMTRHMEVDYLRPAPLHQDLLLIGHHTRRSSPPPRPAASSRPSACRRIEPAQARCPADGVTQLSLVTWPRSSTPG